MDTSFSVAISSTFQDLADHRRAVFDACKRAGANPVVLEAVTAETASPLDSALCVIKGTDALISIFAFRNGWIPEGSDKSIAELEYDIAGDLGIRRLVFMMSDEHPVRVQDIERGAGADKLNRLKERILKEQIVCYFNSVDDLRVQVMSALVALRLPPLKPPKALLLVPFGEEYEELRAALDLGIHTLGMDVFRFDRLAGGVNWANAIADGIQAADVIVAEVTRANPNVMYELGYAHALRKPTILLAQIDKLQGLPSDVSSHQIVGYDRNDLVSLERHLSRALRAYAWSTKP